jgi:hypothetical protein
MFKEILQHILRQPFVASTAVAAAVHSTWTLGTLFAGEQPTVTNIGNVAEWLALAGWLLPALLIAFSLDIGMLATAVEIRNGQRHATKYITFFVLSLSMFYLQFWYLSSHTPAIPIAEGVATNWLAAAETLRGLSVWIIPAMLPISTLLYTFSHGEGQAVAGKVEKKERKPGGPLSLLNLNRDGRRAVLVQGMTEPAPETVTAIESDNKSRDGVNSDESNDKARERNNKQRFLTQNR